MFEECELAKFTDAEILLGVVKELTYLELGFCELTKITGEDLRGLDTLKTLLMEGNEIEQLPTGLFDYTPKLEFVCFERNKINDIDADILECQR